MPAAHEAPHAAPLIMGVLNVTPDSFSDGGEFLSPDRALDHAGHMIAEGADIVDVGGESTRPGAEGVAAAEQIRRTQPVIAAIREHYPTQVISIDTQDSKVASEAIAAGATMINDISALRGDPHMAETAARSGARVVLMHMQGTPRTMQRHPIYTDLVAEIESFWRERIDAALSGGINRDRIILDPGIGFGKTIEHNLLIMARLRQMVDSTDPIPLLIGVSRKSFLSKVLDTPYPDKEPTATTVANTLAVLAGVRILRVHDVRPARQAVALCRVVLAPGADR